MGRASSKLATSESSEKPSDKTIGALATSPDKFNQLGEAANDSKSAPIGGAACKSDEHPNQLSANSGFHQHSVDCKDNDSKLSHANICNTDVLCQYCSSIRDDRIHESIIDQCTGNRSSQWQMQGTVQPNQQHCHGSPKRSINRTMRVLPIQTNVKSALQKFEWYSRRRQRDTIANVLQANNSATLNSIHASPIKNDDKRNRENVTDNLGTCTQSDVERNGFLQMDSELKLAARYTDDTYCCCCHQNCSLKFSASHNSQSDLGATNRVATKRLIGRGNFPRYFEPKDSNHCEYILNSASDSIQFKNWSKNGQSDSCCAPRVAGNKPQEITGLRHQLVSRDSRAGRRSSSIVQQVQNLQENSIDNRCASFDNENLLKLDEYLQTANNNQPKSTETQFETGDKKTLKGAEKCSVDEDTNSSDSVNKKLDEKDNTQQQQKQESSPYMNWSDLSQKFGRMSRRQAKRKNISGSSKGLCRSFASLVCSLIPFFGSFKNYSLPGDLFSDLMAGFTVAVLHVPQGMAYGMLAGIEPIYGLYTSLVPVLVMAFMSKSYHVSYGTFAIISIILSNTCESVRAIMREHRQQLHWAANDTNADDLSNNMLSRSGESLVLTNNHQPANYSANHLLRSFLTSSPTILDQNTTTNEPPITADGWPINMPLPPNIEILTAMGLVVGLMQITMAFMRLGALSLMFSDQLVSSFTTASGVLVVVSQLAGLFDVELPSIAGETLRVFKTPAQLFERLLLGFNVYTALLSLFSIVFLLLIKEYIEPKLKSRYKSLPCIPSELILMTLVICSSRCLEFSTAYGIRIVGHIPTSLPEPRMPRIELTPLFWDNCITVALISYAINLSLAQTYAKRFGYKLDPNQELLAVGTANTFSSFFSCYPCAASLSRSAVQSSLNVKSQLSSLFSCAVVLSIICFFAPILFDLPRSTLSCIIVVALKSVLAQVRDLGENWRRSKLDAVVWIVTFVAVIIFGSTYGLLIGIFGSLFMIFFRLLIPNHSILERLPGTDIYVDSNAFIDCKKVDQVRIFRFNSALCYLNRTMFKECIEKSLPSIYKHAGGEVIDLCRKSRDLSAQPDDIIKFLIIDCSALAFCDYSGAETLVEIIEELKQYNITVYLAPCPINIINMMEKMQHTQVLNENVYPTIPDAVSQTIQLRNGHVEKCAQSMCIDIDSNGNSCLNSIIEHQG